MTDAHLKLSGTVISVGVTTAIVAAILYFMALPIFDAIDLAWTFVVGLVSAASAALTLAIRAIWSNER